MPSRKRYVNPSLLTRKDWAADADSLTVVRKIKNKRIADLCAEAIARRLPTVENQQVIEQKRQKAAERRKATRRAKYRKARIARLCEEAKARSEAKAAMRLLREQQRKEKAAMPNRMFKPCHICHVVDGSGTCKTCMQRRRHRLFMAAWRADKVQYLHELETGSWESYSKKWGFIVDAQNWFGLPSQRGEFWNNLYCRRVNRIRAPLDSVTG